MSGFLFVSLVQATLRGEPLRDPRATRYEWASAPRPKFAYTWRRGYWPRSRMYGADMAPIGPTADAQSSAGWFEYPFKSIASDGVACGYSFCGTTRDASGTALGVCVVQAFRTSDDAYLGECTSGPTGEYCLTVAEAPASYLVAYKPGAPDVAGTTVNTLVPTTSRTI